MNPVIGRPRTLAREIAASSCDVLRSLGFPADERSEKVIFELADSELGRVVGASPWVAAAIEVLRLWLSRRWDHGLEKAFSGGGDHWGSRGRGGDGDHAAAGESA